MRSGEFSSGRPPKLQWAAASTRDRWARRFVGASLCAWAWGLGASAAALAQPAPDALAPPPGVAPGDPARGRALVADRPASLCLLCHSGPFQAPTQQGNLAPSLSGAGSRWSEAQLRLRIVDGRKIHPDSIMPSFGVVDAAPQVASRHSGRPILSSQQIEDVVAFLVSLKD
jgi:sulfur-oxidizing protein SoxX